MLDVELPGPMMIGWGLTEALCYLNHMELRGEVEKLEGEDTGALAPPGRRPGSVTKVTLNGACTPLLSIG